MALHEFRVQVVTKTGVMMSYVLANGLAKYIFDACFTRIHTPSYQILPFIPFS